MRLRIKKHGKNLQLKKTVVLLRRQSLKRSSFAGVVKLVDTLDLGSSASRRGGSSPFTRTCKRLPTLGSLFILINNK